MALKTGQFQDCRICALGLGRFGGQLAAIQYLLRQGATVRVSDTAAPELLTDSVAQLRDEERVEFRFGPQTVDLLQDCQAVLASPGIRPTHPCLLAAEDRGLPVLTELELFLKHCRGTILAVTGTVGKSTTAAMLAHLLKESGHRTWLGGNIGTSLLPNLNQIREDDYIVLELSSFQLHYLKPLQYAFPVAVMTNLLPHHLEWHGSFEEYRAAKTVIFEGQSPENLALLPPSLMDGDWPGAGKRRMFRSESFSGLPNQWPPHDRQNAAAALTVAEWLGMDCRALTESLQSFCGLPHRQERIENLLDRIVINDSKATSPAATLAAVSTLAEPTWLILGGALSRDDPAELLSVLEREDKIQGIALMGPAGRQLATQCAAVVKDRKYEFCEDLSHAWNWCWSRSTAGEVILLSPGYPSFNEFVNFEARGEALKRLVREAEGIAGHDRNK